MGPVPTDAEFLKQYVHERRRHIVASKVGVRYWMQREERWSEFRVLARGGQRIRHEIGLKREGREARGSCCVTGKQRGFRGRDIAMRSRGRCEDVRKTEEAGVRRWTAGDALLGTIVGALFFFPRSKLFISLLPGIA